MPVLLTDARYAHDMPRLYYYHVARHFFTPGVFQPFFLSFSFLLSIFQCPGETFTSLVVDLREI